MGANPVKLTGLAQRVKTTAEIGQIFLTGPYRFSFAIEIGFYLYTNCAVFGLACKVIPDNSIIQKVIRTVRTSSGKVFHPHSIFRGQSYDRKHLAHFEPPPFRPPNISRRNSSVSFADCTSKVVAL